MKWEKQTGLKEENLSSRKACFISCSQTEDKDLRTYSPLTLAYIGDGVYELGDPHDPCKKSRGNCPGEPASQKASSLVKAREPSLP